MKQTAVLLVVFGLSVGALQVTVRSEGPTPAPTPVARRTSSVWDGVFTIGQAKRGSTHTDRCAPCHGLDLEGEFAPTLMGPVFTGKWEGRTLGELYDLIQINFDAMNTRIGVTDPALGRQQSADFLAYILFGNHFPSGSVELPAGIDALKQVRFQSAKP